MRHHANPQAMIGNSDGFTARAIALTVPRPRQFLIEASSTHKSASATSDVARRIERLVSQNSVGKNRAGGHKVQISPATLAAEAPKTRRVNSMAIRTVAVPNMACSNMMTTSDAELYAPNTAKMAATIAGYPGDKNAEGPVDPPKGELSPWPVRRDSARRPNSVA